MKVSLVDVDGHNFPNLALMRLSEWHKAQGDTVDWYMPMFSRPDRIYASKVFTFTPDYAFYAATDPEPIRGGTGYQIMQDLPSEIEATAPDYSIYPDVTEAYGFLTRGCIRKCPWCIVPHKEGSIRIAGDIETIASGRKQAILMDNNFLAAEPDFILYQLGKIAKTGIRIDFNQGLDARLITARYAKAMSACKWIRFIRFSCDSPEMMPHIKKAVRLLKEAGCRRPVFVYMLVYDVVEAEERLRSLVKLGVSPFAQPYRDFTRQSETTKEQRDFARFANIKGGKLCLKMKFKEYYHR